MNDSFLIECEDDLESIIGEPLEAVKQKLRKSLDDSMMEFIRRSPLIFISTVDDKGQVDISPKGDSPGFVHVDEKGNLLIPDRPGNKLMFGFKNILKNRNVGVIFVVPDMRETLRIKGQASLSKDPSLLQDLSARGKPALLCTSVTISECFFHCGKAMIRSNMWNPDAWVAHHDSLMVRQLAKSLDADEEFENVLEAQVEQNYRDELY